jgi:GH15 family glucan-1,4-alpha-glucosidase
MNSSPGLAGGTSERGVPDPRRPISEFALLSDCHSAALVDRAGSVDWLCFPRFDSPSCFARLLDRGAGHWSLRPVGARETKRRYLPGTLVLQTRFETANATMILTDALLFADGARGHEIGDRVPHVLARQV